MPLPIHLMSNFPSVRPSLNLQFDSQPTPADMTSHLASVGATFSRASIGTYTDANGLVAEASAGQARPNYSSAGVHEGLLIEESRTNHIKSSEDFSANTWTASNTIVTVNQAIAPDGLAGADKLIANTVNTNHILTSSFVTVSGALCFSVYAKADGYNYIRTRFNGSSGAGRVWFNLSSGTVGTSDASVDGSIEDVGNGWYRCIAVESGNTNTSVSVQLLPQSADNQTSFAGDGESGVLIWGAQFEEGSFPTSYIPTIPTFSSRASTATFFNASGVLQTASTNVARTDHKYIDGQWVEAGLLLEGASTNLLSYSEDASTGNWNSESAITVTTNAIDAPDGNATADLVAGTATTSLHYLAQNRSLSSSTTYTQSAFVKAEALDYCYLLVNEAGSYGNRTQAYFDLSSGTLDSSLESGDFTLVSTDIVDVSNGWYRISMTFTTGTLTAGIVRFGISDDGSTGTGGFLGDGSGVYMWGFQLEEQSQPTSYIATSGSTATRSADVYTTATVTRSADVCYIDGTAFSDFYNDDEGTVFVHAETFAVSKTYQSYLEFYQNVDNTIRLFTVYQSIQRPRLQLRSGGSTHVDISPSVNYSGLNKIVAKFSVSDNKLYINGTEIGSDTSAVMPTLNKLNIGNITNLSDDEYSGTFKKIIYFPRALSDNELIKLTQ